MKALPFDEWPLKLKELLPNASFDLVENGTSGIGAIVVLHARRRSPIADRDVQKGKPAFERRETATSRILRKIDAATSHLRTRFGRTTSSFVARDPTVRGHRPSGRDRGSTQDADPHPW